MQEKSVRIRERLKGVIPDGYSHLKHLITLAFFTLSPVPFFIAALFIWGMPLWSLSAIPLAFLIGNFVEYATHRWPMHRAFKYFGKGLYRRHAGSHHSAFTHSDMEIRDLEDWYHVMMPPGKAVAFTAFIFTTVAGAYALGGGPFAAVLGTFLCMYFYSEELFHLSFHLPSTWNGDRWYNRLLRRMAGGHHIHHDSRVMKDVNFNIAFPVFDHVFGTLVKSHEDAVQSKRA